MNQSEHEESAGKRVWASQVKSTEIFEQLQLPQTGLEGGLSAASHFYNITYLYDFCRFSTVCEHFNTIQPNIMLISPRVPDVNNQLFSFGKCGDFQIN